MNVLHIYPKDCRLIHQHVQLLVEGLRQSANVMVADNNKSIYQQARDMQADIIHVHGINQMLHTKAMRCARKMNIRYVISLHGQLEPWAIKFQRANQRLGIIIAQRDYIEKAYAVISFGKMETSSFRILGWNPRIEEIRNGVITNAISTAAMCSQTYSVYQKVMDSNTQELMSDEDRQLMAAILKAGITGDRRWLSNRSVKLDDISTESWRHLLIYAEHENIRNYVDYGMNILGLSAPMIDTTKIDAYFPKSYTRPMPIKNIIGEYDGKETNYLVRMVRQIHKQPLLLHLIELTRELYRDTINDDMLESALEKEGLLAFFSQLMQILSEYTLLDEGYMPLPPTDNNQTTRIRKLLTNHLKI